MVEERQDVQDAAVGWASSVGPTHVGHSDDHMDHRALGPLNPHARGAFPAVDLEGLRAATGVRVPLVSHPDPSVPDNAANADSGSVLHPMTVRVPSELLDRARSAWRNAAAEPGGDYPSFQAWVTQALTNAVEASERDHNHGRPWKPTPTGTIPTGRPAR